MGRWDTADETDIWRAMVVDEFTESSWSDYLRARKRGE